MKLIQYLVQLYTVQNVKVPEQCQQIRLLEMKDLDFSRERQTTMC